MRRMRRVSAARDRIRGCPVKIGIRLSFEAAHSLPRVPAGHKCRRLHGHSYVVVIEVAGPVGGESGWVMDLDVLHELAGEIVGRLDHRCLNDHLANPTAERIAEWIWGELAPRVAHHGAVLASVTVHETANAWAAYEGPC